jgi:hypothetical protein
MCLIFILYENSVLIYEFASIPFHIALLILTNTFPHFLTKKETKTHTVHDFAPHPLQISLNVRKYFSVFTF